MRITAKIDYAVRACVELAARYDDVTGAAAGPRWVKADEVAAAQEVSVAFVLGILNELKQAGLVASKRGADGGYRLAFAPAEITIADVIRVVDGPLANVAGRHVEDVGYGGAAGAVRDVWVALRASLRSVLEGVSLEDVATGRLAAPVRALIEGDEAWKTRPHGRATVAGTRS
ncbi:MAG: Rrf2 family transcriptional regulator [Microbacteriaceae bacterium]|nr:Rrf2 family transcriptional regulator [Microbacteriaceae bacterium]MCL2793828.1 Rrf2 family transcriptional regulator [Microbacteriaceae bacterium]